MKIYTVGDLHFGDPHCQIRDFRRFVEMIAHDPRSYVILVGDLLNNAIKSSKSNVYEETIPPGDQQKYALIDELRPIADRILVVISGNHSQRSKRETGNDPTRDIAAILNIPYREDIGFVKVSLGRDAKSKRNSYVIAAVHGAGGGRTLSAGLNIGESLLTSLENVDILCFGHVHRLTAGRIETLRIDTANNYIRPVEKLLVVSSHWLSFGGYSAAGMYRPSPQGPGVITLSGTAKDFRATV